MQLIPIMCAMSVSAIFYAGSLYATDPHASIVIVSLAAGFLGILYAASTDPGDDDPDGYM